MNPELAAIYEGHDIDPRYDVADIVGEFLDARPGQWFAPSQIGRKLHMDTQAVWNILQFMVVHKFAISTDRGAWSKYAGWTSR